MSVFENPKDQIRFLRQIMSDLSVFAILMIPHTKPGRKRAVCVSHFHIFNSPLLCPICNLVVYLVHRIGLVERSLTQHDMLFIFDGTFSHYTPVTADIFAKTLTKVSTKLGFPGIKPHNFKHGILTTLFEAVEQDLETVSQRMYLAVADHKPDYSQEYIVPDLRFIDRKLKRIRASSLNVFVADHTSQFVRVKGLLKRIFPKRLPNTHQIFLPITTQGTTRASHMLFVRLWCASMLEFPIRICNNCERNFC